MTLPETSLITTSRSTPISRLPVWMWRTLMARISPGELHRFNADPLTTVDYTFDVGRKWSNTRHTWQQDDRHPESQEVYRRLGAFVRQVAARPVVAVPLVAA